MTIIILLREFRYGNLKNGAEDIKKHRWFYRINFLDIYNRKMKPPFKPKVSPKNEAENFEKFEEELMKISQHDEYGEYFKDF